MMVSPVTVRQWAQKGLIKAEVTAGGHRRFLLKEVKHFAQDRGMSLTFPGDENLRVLVVDDNVQLAQYLVELFDSRDDLIEVELAHDGFEAGQKVGVFKPHIVLLDLKMPGLDGFEVCHRLKSSPSTHDIRIIAMTGYHSEENVNRILGAGAEVCLAKPFKPAELFEAMGLEQVAA